MEMRRDRSLFEYKQDLDVKKITFLEDFLKEFLNGDKVTDILLRLDSKHQIRMLISDPKDSRIANFFKAHLIDMSCLPSLESNSQLNLLRN